MIATEGEERFAAALQVHRRAGRRTRSWPSCSRPWPATCSATRPRWPSTPRPGRCARPGPRSRTRSSSPAVADGDGLLADLRARARAARRPGSSTACAPAPTTATSRPAPRCGWRRCSATPPASLPLDAYQVEHGKVGTPERRGRGPHRRAHPRPSRSSPGPSTPSSTRPRRSPSASPAPTRACCRSPLVQAVLAAGAPRDRLSYRVAAHPRRPRPGGRRGRSATPATASRATSSDGRRPPIVVVDRGGIAPRPAARAPSATRVLRGTKHRVATEREVTVAAGRSDGRTVVIVPEVKDNAVHRASRCCTCASHDRLPAAGAAAVLAGLPRPLRRPAGRGHRDRADLPRRPARRRCPSSTC